MIRRRFRIAIANEARRFLGALLVVAQIAATAGGLVLTARPLPAMALTCATPGKDGAGGTLSGTVNSYYPGTASASAGATSISVGTKLSGSASANIASGDLLLVIQISGASINSTNTSAYGSGGASGTGLTALNNTGKYEYVKATGAVSGGSVPITGTGTGNGLLNSYTYSGSSSTPAEFEVVRVPQYTTATLSSSLTGVAWQFASGSTLTGAGGIIAVDVQNGLTLGGTVTMTGQGFTGGHNISSTNANLLTYPYVVTSASNATNGYSEGEKGEGVAGAPRYTLPYSTAGAVGTVQDVGATIGDFLTGGGAAAGAPGNAGGGGTNLSASNGGGGGGANGGAGGAGGYSSGVSSGKGGSALTSGATLLYLGGGGGAGDIYSTTAGTDGDGGSGGGMVLVRALSVSGSGTITANGVAGRVGVLNKSDSGGGGAGGTVMVTTTTGTLSGLTINATGAKGGQAASSIEDGGSGGGGAVLLSATGATVTVTGATVGTNNGDHVAIAGGAGTTSTSITPSSIPGVSSGAECGAASPTMTITNPSVKNVTPAMIAVDTFTLTNTSASSGTFALTGAATFGGTASGTTLQGFVLAGASSGTCSVATPCTYTTLNAQAGMASIAAAGTQTVGVEYQVSSSATSGQTIQPSITANVTVSGTTSSNVTNTTYSDTLATDARLDVQTTVVAPSSYAGTIAWTMKANNGGSYAAANLQSAKSVLGSAAAGIALFIPVPSFAGTTLTLQAQPSAPTLTGATSGAAASVYYNATACSSSPTSGWSTTYAASSKCLGILLSGGTGGVELPSATGGSSGAGSVSTAQITFSFTTNQPSGANSGNANAVTLLVSSAVGGNAWATGTIPILGQGVTMGTADAATASLLNGVQANSTASSGTTAPGGASNSIGTQAYDVLPLLGPVNGLGSVGSYNGINPVSTTNAFTAVSYQPAGGAALLNTGTTPGTPVGNTIVTSGVTTVNVSNAFTYAEVSAGGTLTLTGTAPSGWQVQICRDSSGPVCTTSGIWTTINAAGTTSSSVLTLTSLQTLTNYTFWAVYTLATSSNVTAFSRADATVVANDGTTNTNVTTHNELYAGYVPLTRTVTVSSTGCPSGVTPPAGGVCPGGMLLYSIDYRNIITGGTASGNTVPESAFPETAAGTLVLTENGAYLANTNGLNEALVAGANGTSTFGDSTTNSTFSGATIGSTSFTDTVGGANFKLVPNGFTGTNKGWQGTLTFRVIVK